MQEQFKRLPAITTLNKEPGLEIGCPFTTEFRKQALVEGFALFFELTEGFKSPICGHFGVKSL